MSGEVIAVDLDGTLAKYDTWRGIEHIGEPIVPMLNRVRQWLKDGVEVRIFTARATEPAALPYIQAWCRRHIGRTLPVTCIKSMDIVEFWDDRAISVEFNTGRIRTR